MGLQFKHIEPTPITLDCSYCGERMWYTQVKKPVPEGVTDLNIYEGMWQCGDCNQTARDFIVKCNTCGHHVVNFEDDGDSAKKADKLSSRLQGATYPQGMEAIFGYFRDEGQYGDDPYPAQCLHCVSCEECGKKIDFGPDGRKRVPKMAAIDSDTRYYSYFYFHDDCLQQSKIYQNYQKELEENRKAFNKSSKSGCAGNLITIVAIVTVVLLFGLGIIF